MSNRASLSLLIVCSSCAFWALDRFLPCAAVSMVLLGIVGLAALYVMGFAWLQFGRKAQRPVAEAPQPPVKTHAWPPFVNILIPAKNEARVIEGCIRNLLKLDYEHFDVWLIDDGSCDGTADVARCLQQEFADLRVIERGNAVTPGKSAALNDALKLCVGDVIAVFDADAYVESDFLNLILPALEDDDVAAAQAQKRLFREQTDLLVRCQDGEYAFDSFLQSGRDSVRGAVELRGNGQVVKRAPLLAIGGWNERSITDDLDLSTRLLIAGFRCKFVPEAVVWEEGVANVQALLRQRQRWGQGSIRRYLDHFAPFVMSHSAGLRQKVEMFAFISEFSVPPLMLFCLWRETHMLAGSSQPHLIGFIFLLTGFWTWVAIYSGILIYRQELSFFAATRLSIMTNIYLYVLWCPCVFWALSQILSNERASKWAPTEHFGLAPSTTPAAAKETIPLT